jgi:hypothetical protein
MMIKKNCAKYSTSGLDKYPRPPRAPLQLSYWSPRRMTGFLVEPLNLTASCILSTHFHAISAKQSFCLIGISDCTLARAQTAHVQRARKRGRYLLPLWSLAYLVNTASQSAHPCRVLNDLLGRATKGSFRAMA